MDHNELPPEKGPSTVSLSANELIEIVNEKNEVQEPKLR